MMTEIAWIAAAACGGLLAGAFFFGGLWIQIRRLPTAKHPGLWMAGGAILRFAVALGVFFLVGRGHLDRMLACLAGFVVARLLVTRFTRPDSSEGDHPCA